MMTRMSLVKGFFAHVPVLKKVRSWLRTRGLKCSPSRIHPRRLLSWRTPSRGCSSGNASAGKTYNWNRRPNSTVWQAPPGVQVVWIGERNEEGGVWYWHKDARVRTYTLPSSSCWVRSFSASPGRYTSTGRVAYVPVTMRRQVPAVLRVRYPSSFRSSTKCWTFL